MANLERCLVSIADHIECWVIGDWGATDGTPEFIRAFFGKRGLPGDLFSIPACDLDQAHAGAQERACTSRLPFDYLLLADADMELVVEDPDFRNGLVAPCYELAQPSGVSYGSARLLRRDAAVRSHGAYPLAPGDGPLLRGVRCVDHATGAILARKRAQDIRLLLGKIQREPNSGHHWFHLGQALREAGHPREAAKTYAKRAGMGGWDEEAWYARVQEARCLLALNDERGFQRAALAAFDQRPQRAEPLYDLARFYRDCGMNNASVLYAEAGLALGHR